MNTAGPALKLFKAERKIFVPVPKYKAMNYWGESA
jgi:hypothetical protein